MATTESKIEEFAEDLGKMLGQARTKAEGWLGQRQTIVKNLTQLRDEATKLLQDLTGGAADMAAAVRSGRRGRPAGSKNKRGPCRPKATNGRKKRTMSAQARAAISAAQKKRWAAQKAGEKKK